MGPQQAEALHQSIKKNEHWERACVVQALEPATNILCHINAI